MKGSWGDKSAVPLARGTRSLRSSGLCKRGGRFPVSRHGCFPALLVYGCSPHRELDLQAPPPTTGCGHSAGKVHRTHCMLSASGKAASKRSLLTPPHAHIPGWNPYHSMTACTPTSDPPMSVLTGACRLRGLPWAASSLFQPQDRRVRACGQPQPWKSLSVFPQGQQHGPEMTPSSCATLYFLSRSRWEQDPGWNGTGEKPNGRNLIFKKWVFHWEGIGSKNRPKYICERLMCEKVFLCFFGGGGVF